MCQPASLGSFMLGNRTGTVPPTPSRGIQPPGPRSASYVCRSAGDVPAVAKAGPSGQGRRTTGWVQVLGSRGSTTRARSSFSMTPTHASKCPAPRHPAPQGIRPRRNRQWRRSSRSPSWSVQHGHELRTEADAPRPVEGVGFMPWLGARCAYHHRFAGCFSQYRMPRPA